MPSSQPEHIPPQRIGGLARSAKEPSGAAMLEKANKAFRDSFDVRHECDLCGVVEVDQALPAKERQRQSAAAYRAHMSRISRARTRAHSRELAARRDRYAAEKLAAQAELLDNAV